MEAKFQKVELKLKNSTHSEETINSKPKEESLKVRKKSLTEAEEVQNHV